MTNKKTFHTEDIENHPMKLDENGDVVFADGKYCKFTTPSPLMLVNEIAKLFVNFIREKSSDTDIQGSYREIIFHLSHQDGRTQLELASLTHLKPPTISVALQKLEDQGYVVRESDPFDLRKVRVYLTDKGREVESNAMLAIKDIDKTATKDFTEDEIKALNKLLYKLRSSISVVE